MEPMAVGGKKPNVVAAGRRRAQPSSAAGVANSMQNCRTGHRRCRQREAGMKRREKGIRQEVRVAGRHGTRWAWRSEKRHIQAIVRAAGAPVRARSGRQQRRAQQRGIGGGRRQRRVGSRWWQAKKGCGWEGYGGRKGSRRGRQAG